jgi:hypothetical protein
MGHSGYGVLVRDPILLGDGDVADVCAVEAGFLMAYVPIVAAVRQQLRLAWFDIAGTRLYSLDLPTNQIQGGVGPRLCTGHGRTWLAYRANIGGLMMAVLREVVGMSVTEPREFGRADGQMALSADWFAWQNIPAGVTLGLNLVTGEARTLRHDTRGNGLSRLVGDRAVFIDEDLAAVPGMLTPCWAGDAIVGEGPVGGIAVQFGTPPVHLAGTLMPGTICGTPRGAQRKAGEYAAVCWGGPGVRLVLFSPADVLPAHTNPGKPPEKPPTEPVPDPAPVPLPEPPAPPAPGPAPVPQPTHGGDMPTLDQWIHQEFPQLVAAFRLGHPELGEPGAEWAAFQTYRRYVELWPLSKMIAHERAGALPPKEEP